MRAKLTLLTPLLVAAVLGACATDNPGSPPEQGTLQPVFGRVDEDACSLYGRMTGGGGQHAQIGGIYITRGFTIHCDIMLSNNLEINWPGNQWHLDKPLTFADCSNDPNVDPAPPPAPFDTFYGEGIGRLNGVDGARVEFTFVDGGEPSGGGDRAAIRIFDPNGIVVLDLPLSPLDNGNIQAHYDQPHGNKP